MQKTKIEWADYSINPVKGLCPMDCKDNRGKPYCYARKMYRRFHLDETIRFDKDWFATNMPKKPSRIFVGSTMELFGKWVKDEWVDSILKVADAFPRHTFIFLSKQPYNLSKWKFPNNCWVGISTTGNDSRSGLEDNLKEVKAKIKFVSIEPLLDYTPMDFRWVDWVIVGRQTPISEKTKPHLQWITDIVQQARCEHKPIFLKNNLESMLENRKLIQEFPRI